jgi:hypothetical protein
MAAFPVSRTKIGGAKTLGAQDTLRQAINLLASVNGPASEMNAAQIEEWTGFPSAQAAAFQSTVSAIYTKMTSDPDIQAFLNQIYGTDA